MKLKNILFVVKDIEQSKSFYQELFGLHVIADFGTNVVLSEGLVLQEQKEWEDLIHKSVVPSGHSSELYFEEQNIQHFQKKIEESGYNITYINQVNIEDTPQVLRFYDPDFHIIEVKEKVSNCIGSIEQMEEKVLAIDIGGTSVKHAYVSSQGEITEKGRFKTGKTCDLQIFLKELCEVVKKAVSVGVQKVGISSLGIFRSDGLCLGGVENLAFLKGVNLTEQMQMWYPELECHIINDGTAAADGEYWLGEGMDCDSFICMTLGTGIGGAIIIDGKPIHGSHFQSGEIGYSNYKSEDDYLERKYSTKAVLAEAAKQLQVEKIGGIAFVEAVKNKDAICEQLFEEWMEALAGMLSNAVLLLDPEKIILGGGVSGEKDWICKALKEKLDLCLPQAFHEKLQVCVAKNGNDAGLLGAAEIFFHI